MFAGFSAGQLLYDLSLHHRRSQKCSSPWYRHLHCRLRNLLKPPIFRPCWLDEPYKLLLFYVIARCYNYQHPRWIGASSSRFWKDGLPNKPSVDIWIPQLGCQKFGFKYNVQTGKNRGLHPRPMPRYINSKENGWLRSCRPPTFYDRNAHSRCFELSYNVIFRHWRRFTKSVLIHPT